MGDVRHHNADPGRRGEQVPAGVQANQATGEPDRNALPATAAEITAISGVFKKTIPQGHIRDFRGTQPTEENVREAAPHCSYLHFATHGYFNRKLLRSKSADGDNNRQRTMGEDLSPFVSSAHPDVLCGIALVGASRQRVAGMDDGLLTALEVKALDLERTELVTLSACQTTLGMQLDGEGTLGLQRAFQMAGARSTVTTLWSVNSLATSQLMIDFYSNLWSKKMSRIEALRQAQLKMLRQGRSEAGKANVILKLAAPYFWSGFVLSGDWR